MNILTVHNYYQIAGGEDPCFEAETEMLSSRGHTVLSYTLHNDDVEKLSRLKLIEKTFWNRESAVAIETLIKENSVDVVHFHNTFPLISPSAIEGAKKAGALVIQSLHNYRLLCLNSYLARDGGVCELCIGKTFKYPGILKKCYRGSIGASAITALMLGFHKFRKTWIKNVDAFIALTEFEKIKLVEGGLPADRIFVKPNFVDTDPGFSEDAGSYALYIGRLSEEKGVRTLLKAFGNIEVPLKIAGSGPLETELRGVAGNSVNSAEFLGRVNGDQIISLLKKSSFLILPSECYETFGRVIVEAYACGKPVIVSKLGAMKELVKENVTGLHFEAGNSEDLAAKAESLWLDSDKCEKMGIAAREEYLKEYTVNRNYDMLMGIYSRFKEPGN